MREFNWLCCLGATPLPAVYNSSGIVTFPIHLTLTDQPLLGNNGSMLEAAIAICALIVLAGVLWLRPWVDDYSNPYE